MPKEQAETNDKGWFLTPVGRVNFVNLAEPNPSEEYGGKYDMHLMIPKEVWKSDPLARAIHKEVLRLGQENIRVKDKETKEKRKPVKISEFEHFIRDGDKIADDKDIEVTKDQVILVVKSDRQPKIIWGNKKAMSPAEVLKIKNGDFLRVAITPYFSDKGDKGVWCGMVVVQFKEPGPPIGGLDPDDVMGDIEELDTEFEAFDGEATAESDAELDLDEEDADEDEAPKKGKKGRGRPAGSKNKGKETAKKGKAKIVEVDEEDEDEEDESGADESEDEDADDELDI